MSNTQFMVKDIFEIVFICAIGYATYSYLTDKAFIDWVMMTLEALA